MSRFQSFHIYRRKNSSGKYIHYVRFLDPETGDTIQALSSGLGNRTAAVRWAESKLPEIEAEITARRENNVPTVAEYAQNYFLMDSDINCLIDQPLYVISKRNLQLSELVRQNTAFSPCYGLINFQALLR